MQIEQSVWTAAAGWHPVLDDCRLTSAQLVLGFGAPAALRRPEMLAELRSVYPDAYLAFASTAGEILNTTVLDQSLVITALHLEKSRVQAASLDIINPGDGYETGLRLVDALDLDDLALVFVLSDGLQVNGSRLVAGIQRDLPLDVVLTGGLSGDGADFNQTLVGLDEHPKAGKVIAVGFSGRHLEVGHGVRGGWDSFGPERLITRSEGNVLYELDGQSALGLYKRYLGDYAADLPSSGLLFPLSVRADRRHPSVVRTILAANEEAQSLTFAGDIPPGGFARFMMANFDRLIDGAQDAAQKCLEPLGQEDAELALLVSCVGRKLVLEQRIEEEVESVRDVLGTAPALVGFYSYGELSPRTPSGPCQLHNQTMMITTLRES